VLPTIEQVYVVRESFPRRRVDAFKQQHSPALGGDALRLQIAAEVRSAWSLSFLPLRARKEGVTAGGVRDGP
jgi:hypothetical protein